MVFRISNHKWPNRKRPHCIPWDNRKKWFDLPSPQVIEKSIITCLWQQAGFQGTGLKIMILFYGTANMALGTLGTNNHVPGKWSFGQFQRKKYRKLFFNKSKFGESRRSWKSFFFFFKKKNAPNRPGPCLWSLFCKFVLYIEQLALQYAHSPPRHDNSCQFLSIHANGCGRVNKNWCTRRKMECIGPSGFYGKVSIEFLHEGRVTQITASSY